MSGTIHGRRSARTIRWENSGNENPTDNRGCRTVELPRKDLIPLPFLKFLYDIKAIRVVVTSKCLDHAFVIVSDRVYVPRLVVHKDEVSIGSVSK